MSEANVATPAPGYQAMSEEWCTIDDLRGGTATMREAKTKYLPKEGEEDDRPYDNRVNRTFLFPAFSNTLRKIVEKPFSQPVKVAGTTPESVARVLDDTDLAGSDITTLARWLFLDGIAYGRSHLFVDFQRTGGAHSRSDERTGSVRPYFLKVSAKDLISWNETTTSTGETVFTDLRWKETRIERDGFRAREVQWIRAFHAEETPAGWVATWETHRKADKGDGWDLMESGPFVWPKGKGLPFFPFNPGRDGGRMDTIPPLRGLAWLNVEHWQSSSDYRSALRFAALIMLAAYGFTREEAADIRLGHGAFNHASKTDARIEWVEAKGDSIKHLRDDLDRISEQMELEGLQPFMRKRANTTATSQASNDNAHEAPIQAWVREANAVLRDAIWAASLFLGVDLPADFTVSIFEDFRLIEDAPGQVDALTRIWEKGGLPLDVFLAEVQGHSYLSETLDPEEVAARAQEENGTLTGMFDDGDATADAMAS